MSTIQTLRALADETRLRLALTLSDGTFSGQELAFVHELGQPTISHHLKILQTAGIVKARKQAQWCYYSINSETESAKLSSEILRVAAEEAENNNHPSKARVKLVQERRKEKNRDFFNKVAPEWSSLRSQIHGDTAQIPSLINKLPDLATVLEVGCGNGLLLKEICKRSGQTVGVDSSEAMLSEARKNAPKADLRLGHLEHLPVADQSIDYAVASLVFHHLADRPKAISDIVRVLKQGGKLLIFDRTDANSEDLERKFCDLWFSFSSEELFGELAEAGLKREEYLKLDGGEYFILTAIKN